jgi:capsular exopolysaccharide synthesis family protein
MSENDAKKTAEFEKIDLFSFFNDFLHRFRRLWFVVLLLTVGVAALFYYRTSTHYTPSYQAEATVSVELVNGGTFGNRNAAQQMGKIFPYILKQSALSEIIAEDLKRDSVPGTIQVSSITGTNLLTITVTSWDAQLAYDVLESLLENYSEVTQFVVGQTELKEIDNSGVPTDSGRESVIRGSTKRGALIGFVLGVLFVAVHVLTFRTIRNENELRSLLNVPFLGTLPFYHKKQRRSQKRMEINILTEGGNSDYVESMRLIRTRLERQMEGKQVLMVTSSISGEGKSTVAANLAISMALKGKKVVLVDCDLRNPTVSQIFGLEEQFPGLVSLLRGKCSLRETLYEVKDHGEPVGLTLLPGGEREARLVEILTSESMKNTIDTLRQQADVVILDTPPSAMLVDAMMLVRYVDAIAYVVMSDFARRRYIFEGVEELSSSGAPIVGCILNGGHTRGGRYGYYGYYGYRRYGYGSYGYGAKAYGAKGYGAGKTGGDEKKSSKSEHSSSKSSHGSSHKSKSKGE